MASPKKIKRNAQKKRERDLQELRDIAEDVIESDFVPYACLFDPDTILTKDGELMQTIKITGAGYEAHGETTLRNAIRSAINSAVPDASYGIWLHTLRRRQITAKGHEFPDAFSSMLDAEWKKTIPHTASFVNELYITIVKAPKPLGVWSLKGFLKTLSTSITQKAFNSEQEEIHAALLSVTNRMLVILAPFGARKLSIVERDGVFYSEHLEFLEKLINLEERPMPVPERDLSHVLTSGEITFGFNAMEVRTAEGHRRFAVILTLKEYKESTLKGIDQFLEIPCELIVSQCFGFVAKEKAQDAYSRQAEILSFSGDTQLAEWMEINRLTVEEGVTYGQEQTTLFIIAPSMKQLESNIKLVRKALSRLGLVVVREDLRFEDCYWAQLPGNFNFVVRQVALDTPHLAGFANLKAGLLGNREGSPWGPPVSILTTIHQAPYAFNFHRDNSAHTIIIGKPGTQKTEFAHFLLAQSRKLNTRICYIDVHQRAGPLIKAMGGNYYAVGTPALRLNPFQLSETDANRQFLALWLSTLVDPKGEQLNTATLTFFQSLVNEILKLPLSLRRLSSALPMLEGTNAPIASKLREFCVGGIYGNLFDAPDDNFSMEPLMGLDIGVWMNQEATRIPLTSYLLHKITASLDNTPTLLVLDEGFDLLNTPLFSGRIVKWCEYLTSMQAGYVILSDNPARSGGFAFSSALSQTAATFFAFADADPDPAYITGLSLSQEEVNTIIHLDAASNQFLQKRGNELTVLSMDFSPLSQSVLLPLSGKEPQNNTALNPVRAHSMEIGSP